MSESGRTKWCQPQTLALIAGYEKFRCLARKDHILKKLLWHKVKGYIIAKTGVSISAMKIKAKWRKLELSYRNACVENSPVWEMYSTCPYYDELHKVLGMTPVSGISDSNCVEVKQKIPPQKGEILNEQFKQIKGSTGSDSKPLQINCVVRNCGNNQYSTKEAFHKNVAFFRFPNEENQRRKWMVILKDHADYLTEPPRPHMRICSDHFEKDAYTKYYGRYRLFKNRVPTIFKNKAHLDWLGELEQQSRYAATNPKESTHRKLTGIKCFVPNCKNVSRSNHKGILFFPFPRKKQTRDIWLASLKLKAKDVTIFAIICSDHFGPDDFFTNTLQYHMNLKPSAVPHPYYADSEYNSDSDDDISNRNGIQPQIAGIPKRSNFTADLPPITFSYTNPLNGVADIDRKIAYLMENELPKQKKRKETIDTLIDLRQTTLDRLYEKLDWKSAKMEEQKASIYKEEFQTVMENDEIDMQILRQQLATIKGVQKNIYSADIIDMAIKIYNSSPIAYRHMIETFHSLPSFEEVFKYKHLLAGKELAQLLYDEDRTKLPGKTMFDVNLEQVDVEDVFVDTYHRFSDDSDDNDEDLGSYVELV